MPTEAKMRYDDRRSKERIAAADRHQREKSAKYAADTSAKASTDSATIKAVGQLGSKIPSFFFKNDPEWYKHYTEAADIETNLPSFVTNGTPIEGSDPNIEPQTLPVALIIPYHNVFGDIYNLFGQTQPTDQMTLNNSSDRLLAILRSYNSRFNSYPAYDLMQFLYGEMEAFRFIIRAVRIVQIFTQEDAFNPFIRKALIEDLGWNYSDVETNIASMRAWLAETIADLNTHLVLPADFPLISRKLYLDTVVLREGQGNNAQYVAFYSIEYHRYNELSSRLDPYKYSSLMTWNGFVNEFAQIMSSLKNASYYVNVKADMLDAEAHGLKLFRLDPSIVTKPLVISDMSQCLDQIMNANVLPIPDYSGSSYTFSAMPANTVPAGSNWMPTIAALSNNGYKLAYDATQYLLQDTNGFLYPCMTSTGTRENFTIDFGIAFTGSSAVEKYAATKTKYLNFFHNKVTSDDVMEATRLRHLIKVTNSGTGKIEVTNYMTEIIPFIVVDYGYGCCKHVLTTFQTSGASLASRILHPFNYSPTQIVTYASGPNTAAIHVQQWDKVMSIQDGNLILLNHCAFKSLFWIAPKVTEYSYKGRK